MARDEATKQILEAKRAKGLTWEEIATSVGRHAVWTTAALLGQHPMSWEEAQAAARVLGFGPEVALALQQYPMRGTLDSPVPVDPTISRLCEQIL